MENEIPNEFKDFNSIEDTDDFNGIISDEDIQTIIRNADKLAKELGGNDIEYKVVVLSSFIDLTLNL